MSSWDVISSIGSIISAIAASGALAITGWPKFINWFQRRSIDNRMNKFFLFMVDKPNYTSPDDSDDCKQILIKDYFLKESNSCNVSFYKYQKICLINDEKTTINEVRFKCGYYPYTVISENCIRIDIVDSSLEFIKHIYIQRNNNVSKGEPFSQRFKTIYLWKYEE